MSFIFLAFINTKYFVFINTYFSLFTNNNMIMFINDHIMGSNLQFFGWNIIVATFKILIFLLEHILVWVFLVCTDQVNQFRFSPVRKRWYIDVYEQYLLLSFKQFCLLDIHILAFINSYIALFINGVYLPFINNTEFGDVIPGFETPKNTLYETSKCVTKAFSGRYVTQAYQQLQHTG